MARPVLTAESMKNMSAATNLKRRGAVYYCRRRIPQDLLKHYGGRLELAVSLRTKSLQEARRRGNAQWLQWEEEFRALRANGTAATPQLTTVVALTDEQITALAEEHYHGMLHWDEQARMAGLDEETYTELQEEVTRNAKEFGPALARNDPRLGGMLTYLTLERHGIQLSKESPSYQKLSYALLKAATRANDAVLSRQQGKVVDTPKAPSVHIKGNGMSLHEVLQRWSAERRPRAKTKAEWTGFVRDFTKMHGELPVGDIQKTHVIAYKDSLVEAQRAPGTIKTRLAAIHSLLEYAMQNDLCERNPAAAVRVHAAKARTREHIPLEVLQRLFSSPIFTEGLRPRGGRGEAAYWLPLLALYSGARLEELGQMMVQDVKVQDGIHYFEVTGQGEGQKLKTKGSRRSVPIHPELQRLGFLRYIEGRKVAGDVRIFPLLKKDTHDKWTQSWSQWWARYRRSIGVAQRWHDIHALRHTFKRQCRECGIPKDVHDALTGHSSGDVGDAYGGQYPIRPLWEAIQKLRYDGLILPAPEPAA